MPVPNISMVSFSLDLLDNMTVTQRVVVPARIGYIICKYGIPLNVTLGPFDTLPRAGCNYRHW